MTNIILITRWQSPRSRFATGPGPAWKYMYDLKFPVGYTGPQILGFDRLATIERVAKKIGKEIGADVRRGW